MSSKEKALTDEETGNKLLQSVKEMKMGEAARITQIASNQVASARLKTGLSQVGFAKALQISMRTLQGWEQGRRSPSGAAKALIQIAVRHPEIIKEGLEIQG